MHDWYGGVKRLKKSIGAYKGDKFEQFYEKLKYYSPVSQDIFVTDYFMNNEKPITLQRPEIEKVWERIDKDDDWELFYSKIKDIRKLKVILKNEPKFIN